MDVEVWTTTSECHSCGEKTVIWYPRALGSRHGGTWKPVGKHLANLPDSPIEKTYSEVQECEVWGNTCEACDEYQGNYYIFRDARDAEALHSLDAIRAGECEEYDVLTIDIPLSCTVCGCEEVRLPSSVCGPCLLTDVDDEFRY